MNSKYGCRKARLTAESVLEMFGDLMDERRAGDGIWAVQCSCDCCERYRGLYDYIRARLDREEARDE